MFAKMISANVCNKDSKCNIRNVCKNDFQIYFHECLQTWLPDISLENVWNNNFQLLFSKTFVKILSNYNFQKWLQTWFPIINSRRCANIIPSIMSKMFANVISNYMFKNVCKHEFQIWFQICLQYWFLIVCFTNVCKDDTLS